MKRDSGSVLLLSLWAVAVLSGLAIAQALRVSLELKWAHRLQKTRQAWYLAWTGVNVSGQELADDADPAWDSPKEDWGQVPKEAIPFGPGRFQYRIQDEQAKVPLNSAPLELLVKLPGFSSASAQELIVRRNEGKRISHLAELLTLNGFPEEALPELSSRATVYGSGPVNMNTAPAAVLVLLGFSPPLAARVEGFQLGPDGKSGTPDDGLFPDAEQLSPLLDQNLGPLLPQDQELIGRLVSSGRLGTRSSFFRVEAEGWASPHQTHVKATAVLERGDRNAIPVVRSWHEN